MPSHPQRPSSELAPGERERRLRSSAEFVVNLGPPEPIASYASFDLDSGGGSASAPARGEGPPTPPARPDLLSSIDDDAQMTLRFSRISAFVSSRVTPPGLLERARRAATARRGGGGGGAGAGGGAGGEAPAAEERQILVSISGDIVPGEVLALMGPSGSGKTSLLSVISGRAPRAVRTRGRVTVNGAAFTKVAKRRVGFVLQDDLLYESLTVEETLGYAAALRLPRGVSAAERRVRVDDVISALGLGKCRGTIIGGYFRRGISGGERKRVSIGHELLINPAILLLDEPTSGLDSTTALHLLQLLQDLAAGGRSIATTIHQPSSRLYQKLDKLMLLADGHVVYYGGAGEVLSWFSALGFACPYGVNVADFLLDAAQGEVARDGGGGQPANGTGAAKGGKHGDGANGGGASVTAAAGGGGQLIGAPAVVALWASYEEFARTHKQGYTRKEQLGDLALVLEPPGQGAAKGAPGGGGGLDVETGKPATAAAGRKESHGGLRALSERIMRKRGPTGGGGSSDDDDDDNESKGGGMRREITRVFSRSSSTAGGVAGGGSGGGCWGAVTHWTGTADRGGASYWVQLKVLTLRQLKVRRFESLSGQRFSQLIVIAILTGLFWWQRGGGGRGPTTLLAAGDVVGLLFFELLFPAFQALFSALFLFPSESKMLTKERSSGMYRVSAFYGSTIAADLPLDMLLPALFCVIIYFMGGLRLTAGAFFANISAMVLLTLCAQSWGLLLGAVLMNPKTAQTVASVMMLTFMLVGGFYVREVPGWIAWSKYLSFIFWGFNLLLKIEFAGRTLIDCTPPNGAPPGGLTPCVPVDDVRAALNLPSDPNDSPALDIAVSVATLVVLRAAIYWALRAKTKAS